MSNSHLFAKLGHLNVPLQNGIGRYVCQLQRIVFKFCKNHGSSHGMRDFIENDLVNFAKEQPGVVVYLKPRRHRSPIIIGEYLNGERQWICASEMSREEINRWTMILLGSWDAADVRYTKPCRTWFPSIQGPWTPFNAYLNEPHDPKQSEAYKKLLEMAEKLNVKQNTVNV